MAEGQEKSTVSLVKEDVSAAGLQVKPTIDNFYRLITNHYGNNLRQNEMTGKPEWWDNRRKQWREWTDAQESEARAYFESTYSMYSQAKLQDALKIYFYNNKVNPLLNILEKLEWDGKPRVEQFLHDVMKVEDSDYTRECSRLIFDGGIHRAYRPGCKFDYVPILVGPQGIGKSRYVALLAHKPMWYSDNFNTIEGDKAAEKLRGMWGVEIAELLALKRSKEVESFKSFLTSTSDIYRAPYQRITENRPRMCVFFGTANDTQFMTDKTGNRRFLPIRARTTQHNAKRPAMQDAFGRDVSQAWGESVGIVKKAIKNTGRIPDLVLPPAIREEAEAVRASYVEEDARVGIIQEWLDTCHLSRVCVPQIYKEALGGEPSKMQLHESKAIHQIMATMPGWQKYHANNGKARVSPFGAVRCYEPIPGYVEWEDLDEDGELPL